MLSNLERILFIILTISSLGLAWISFGRMLKAISRGTDPIDWKKVIKNWPKGLAVFISQKTLFKTRPIVGTIHAGIA